MNWPESDPNFGYRGTGRTTRQMLAAPLKAVYVCVNEQDTRRYARELARKINRGDLELVGPSWLGDKWEGRILSGLVLDHACRFTSRQWEGLRGARTRVRPA